MALFRSRKRTAAQADALAKRIQPPPTHADTDPPDPQPDLPRAARQEFGTGLRTRVGGSDPGCWSG